MRLSNALSAEIPQLIHPAKKMLSRKDKEDLTRAVVEMIKRDFVLVPKRLAEVPALPAHEFLKRTMDFILSEFNVSKEVLESESAKDEHVRARMVFSYLCKRFGPTSLTDRRIADQTKRLSHTSVIGHVTRVEKMLTSDEVFNVYIGTLIERYKNQLIRRC